MKRLCRAEALFPEVIEKLRIHQTCYLSLMIKNSKNVQGIVQWNQGE